MYNPYKDFTKRLNLFIVRNPELIAMTLGNIFTMRLIGNKTHGDLAEIALRGSSTSTCMTFLPYT